VRISKVVRRKGGGGKSPLNAVVAVNIGETGKDTTASTRQRVGIVQRDGRTEVREHHTDDKE